MRRFLKVLAWVVGIVLAIPVLAIVALFIALNTNPGRDEAAALIGKLSGNTVKLTGLSGRFPDHLRLAHVALTDKQGTWLTADDVALDWSPTALLHKQALVHNLTAARFDIARLPVSAPAAQPAQPSKPFTLPVTVTIQDLQVAQAHIGKPLLGATDATIALTGHADIQSLQSGTAAIAFQPTDPASTARYTIAGTLSDTAIQAKIHANEPAGGLLARLASLPDLGPITLDLTTDGPKADLATTLALDAGPLTARAKGIIDSVNETLKVDATAKAPAMTPAPGVSWQSIDLDAHVAGPFTRPDASGHLRLDALDVAGASLKSLQATLAGNAGQATIDATLDQLRIPGPSPALLAAAPIQLHAQAQLDAPGRPVRFTVTHPLLQADGTAITAGPPSATVTLTLPDLTPIGAIAGLDLAGHTDLTLKTTQTAAATSIDATGNLALTRGPAPAPALIGDTAKLALSATLAGSDITLRSLTLNGAALNLAAQGTSTPAGLDATVKATLPKLNLAVASLTGDATLDAHVTGQPNDLALQASIKGNVGAPGIPQAPITLAADLTGLPAKPAGHVTAGGTLAGAPVAVDVTADRSADGTLHATIQKADWRSFHAEGDLTLAPGSTFPQGHVAVRMARIEDLRAFLNQQLAGSLTATADLGPDAITLDADAKGLAFQANRLAAATLKARIADPLGDPTVNATLAASGIDAAGTTGKLRLEANGPQNALALKTTADLVASGTPATIAATATLDVPAHKLRLQTTQATLSPPNLAPETIRLTAPATITYSPAVTVDRLRLAVRQATLDIAGRLSPTLDATVALRTPADIAAALSPEYAADGTLMLDAKLTGTPAAPTGTVRLAAQGLHLRTGPGSSAPPASITANATLNGAAARLDVRASAGSATVAVNGTAPLNATGPLNLQATGNLDLTLLDPILTAAGRRVRGRVALNASIAGTPRAPRLAGSAQLTGGEVQDFAQGFRLYDLAAAIRLEGDTLRIASLTGKAGQGTIAASGTVGILAPTIPVNLQLTLRNARPLASDLITVDADGNLTLGGAVTTGLRAAGGITIRRANLQVPRTLPASVVTLNVRRPGDKPELAAKPGAPIALDLTINAPGQIFLRGRGIDAELQGMLHIRGTSTAPQVSGGFDMRRGSISIAGTTLDFTRGKVGFDGTGVSGKIDPTLDFAADSTSGSVTATLAISGYVSKPVIKLTSVPELPQDEVLAYLIFKRSAKELGPFQIAEIAAAVADLTGVGGAGGLNPLESVRKGLGLDRLSVGAGNTTPGSSNSSSSPTIEAGRYVASGVYVGAKQGTSGSQTQATVQIDITKGLKVETDVGSGTGGNQVGLTYQYEY